MTEESAPPEPLSETPAVPESPPKSYGSLAQMIARRTTDLIAIALLAMAGLYIGSTLTDWWSTDPAEIATPAELAQALAGAETAWGTDGSPVFLEFGNQPGELRRQSFAGTAEQALALLVQSCEPIVKAAREPAEPPEAGELKLLKRLETLEPRVEFEDGGRIDCVVGPVPLVTGTRQFPAGGSAAGSNDSSRRVVCWGLLFPASQQSWTLFTFTLSPVSSNVSPWPEFDLPPNSRRSLSFRSNKGAMLIGFTGIGPPDVWVSHFQDTLEKHGWDCRAWDVGERRWKTRFQSTGENQPGWIDIQFTKTDSGLYRGLISASPYRNTTEGNTP